MMMASALDHAKLVHRAWRYRLRHDRQEIRYVLDLLRPGDVAVDIGAHKGAYTYWMRKQVGPAGQVFAFEPQPQLATRLRRALSSPAFKNVVIECLGLSSRPGTLILHVPGDSPSPGASFEKQHGHNEDAYAVRVDSLDHYFLEGHQLTPQLRVALIKCDVEGHELEVFRGGQELLRTHRPALLFECEQRHQVGGSVAEVFSFLQGLGYAGRFFGAGRLAELRDFDPARHQRQPGENYVNNFIFTSG